MVFARTFRKLEMPFFRNVVWSDECYIYVGDDNGRTYVTRKRGDFGREEYMVPRFQKSEVKLMIWSCIALGVKGPLIILRFPGGKGGGVNGRRFRRQVLSKMLPFIRQLQIERPGLMFQQDNAPSHKADLTKGWIARKGIRLFPHPAYSPDISPIEPIWRVLKRKINNRPRHPTSLAELEQAIREEWANIPQMVIDNYIRAMPKRLQALYKAKGGPIGK